MCYPDSQGNYTNCSWQYAGTFQGQLCDEDGGAGIDIPNVNNCELQVINSIGIIATVKIYSAKLIAEQLTAERYGTSFCDNDCCNAFKHAMWMAKSAALVGPAFALAFGTAHECEHSSGNLSQSMDLYNNAVGATIGTPFQPWTSTLLIRDAVIAALNGGLLKKIDNGVIVSTNTGCN